MKKQPFFMNLYNLHLSGKIPPLEEEKRVLTKNLSTYNDYPLRISSRQNFTIVYRKPLDRYYSVNWWEKEFPHFAKEYTHLRSFVDGYLKGYFSETNQTWFREQLKLFDWDLSMSLSGDGEANLTMIMTCPNESTMTENECIFALACWELVDLFRTRKTIRSCADKNCDNIFLKGKGGSKHCFECRKEGTAKKEVDKQNKGMVAEQKHTQLIILLDEWLPQKGEESIDAASLIWKLEKFSHLTRKPKYLQSPRSLGRYLNLQKVQDMLLEKKRIHIEVYKDRKGATYNFRRIQS